MRDALPIDIVLGEITQALQEGTRLVLAAPPGAGKTTRVPLALLDADWLGDGRILMLEPRRLAARSAAERLAHNLGEQVGHRVGYRIRGESKTSGATRVEVITEGILTRMIQSDPELPGIAAILFDEVHERSIHSDLGLALALEVQDALREDLRLVAMSATVDVGKFSTLMRDCPTIESAGQIFPIETKWLERPWRDRQARMLYRQAFTQAARSLVVKAAAETDGDVLVFLPGAGEIHALHGALEQDRTNCEIRPLFGAMPLAAQRAVLDPKPGGPRKIVLATAIAETSLTVPGVRTVVDTGMARRPRTDPATGMGRLDTVSVSIAEADQRRGRAGRLGPGTCYRMWTRGQEGAFERFALPEILTADITALALELAHWGAGDPEGMAFLDLPKPAALTAARSLLQDLGALDASGAITEHGKGLLSRPVHPRLAHMMALSEQEGSRGEGALIAAVLSARPGQLQRDVPGGDLSEMLSRCASGPATPAIRSIRDEARRLCGTNAWKPYRLSEIAPGLVASAYPDRVSMRRSGDQPRYLLRNGRGAVLPAEHPLAAQRLIVATDLEDGREARIRAAIALDEGTVRARFPDQIHWHHVAEWSARQRRVETRKREMLGAVALRDEIWQEAPPDQIGAALGDGIRELGLDVLRWSDKAARFRRRVAWANAASETPAFPDLSDSALLERLDDWLVPHLSGLRTIAAASRLDHLSILKAAFDWNAMQALEQSAPEFYVTPAGTKRPVDYAADAPVVAVRIQEMYGTSVHPCLGGGVPILFELLSPADRPVQTTADLPNFWRGSYSDVRRDLRIRYPRHDWPEDPANAAPKLRSTRARGEKHTKN